MFSKSKIIEILNAEDCYIDDFILDAFIKNWKIDAIYEDENGINYYDELALNKIRNGLQGKSPDELPKQKVEEPAQEITEEIKEENSDEKTEEPQQPEEIQEPAEIETIAEQIKNVIEEDISTIAQNIAEKEEEKLQTQEVKETEILDDKDLPTSIQAENKVVETQSTELKNVTLDITNHTLSTIAGALAKKITDEVSQYLKNANFLEKALQTGEIKKDNELLTEKINEVINDNKILITKIRELDDENRRYIKVFGNFYIKK